MSNKTSSTGGHGQGTGNITLLLDPELCTIETCELNMSSFLYIPSLPGNAIMAAIFGILLVGQLGLGIKHKTWGYMVAMVMGFLLEIIGYSGRIILHNNPFSEAGFLQYLVTMTIAPAFLTAAIYLCLGRIVNVYGAHLSYFKPRTYTIVFCTFDFICLLLQAAGGAIASTAEDEDGSDLGRNIMIAGLIFQVVALGLFMLVGGYYAFCVYKGRGTWNQKYLDLVNTWLFKAFPIGLGVATLTIQIRSIYRCAELWGGFDSDLFMGHEPVFMVLEGVMIIIAGLCLTLLHPAVCFQGAWDDMNFHFRTRKGSLLKSQNSSDEEAQMTNIELRETRLNANTAYNGRGQN